MKQKLKSRHPIDIPVDWKRGPGIASTIFASALGLIVVGGALTLGLALISGNRGLVMALALGLVSGLVALGLMTAFVSSKTKSYSDERTIDLY